MNCFTLPCSFTRAYSNGKRFITQNLLDTQKKKLEFIAHQLEIRHPSEWYQVTEESISLHGGKSVVLYYNSLCKALMKLYPDYEWLPWKFKNGPPKGYWDHEDHRKLFFNWLGKQLNFQSLEDYYKLNHEIIEQYGGSKLLRLFGDSFMAALQSTYPHIEWLTWRFNKVPTGFWDVISNQRNYLEWLGKQLGYKKLDDW